ncbi:OVARIAN TUMOR DOMAIN-containing deubiquitinating enzyme 9 [Geodia barretti]|uniref:OVARIAN TUMOR DOMAIN-containing deubiquitinating enzyme 9 n=1 Tax=Geodia barretti TaxID=519541 RepID=A0AA35SU10_GEOBA|nr:OVARIAN TUMOR DOMAIN-containing deubiquitinating enzyme 9 [Geodia barretti]
MRSVRRIQGDGNCLFRAFSYILTGSADQHIGVRHAIIDHMTNNAQYFRGHHLVGYGSIQSYIAFTGMDQDGTWGTDIEMLSLAHLFQTPVFSYSQQHGQWQRYSPHDVDRQLMDDIHQSSLKAVIFCLRGTGVSTIADLSEEGISLSGALAGGALKCFPQPLSPC